MIKLKTSFFFILFVTENWLIIKNIVLEKKFTLDLHISKHIKHFYFFKYYRFWNKNKC